MNALRLVREVDRKIDRGELSIEEGVAILSPLTNVEPVRHGHWIEHSSWYIVYSCECSECGQIINNLYYNPDKESAIENAGLYCKRCGAKMDEVTE